MIDTDKYEGHTRGSWNLTPEGHIVADDMTVVCNKHTKRIVETNHKDAQLMADAPLLLAFYKRIKEIMDMDEIEEIERVELILQEMNKND